MLRWLIAFLFLANMVAFVLVRGVFGPPPAGGPLEPGVRARQIHPDIVRVSPLAAPMAATPRAASAP